MTEVVITHGQLKDALTTCALLCGMKYTALGMHGLARSDKPMSFNDRGHIWEHEDGSIIQLSGLREADLMKYAQYHTTQVEADVTKGIRYIGSNCETFVYYDPCDQYIDISQAEVKDMLSVFCHLSDFTFAELSAHGIVYYNGAPNSGERSRGTNHSPLNEMNLVNISADELRDTLVEIVPVDAVRYDHDPAGVIEQVTFRQEGIMF